MLPLKFFQGRVSEVVKLRRSDLLNVRGLFEIVGDIVKLLVQPSSDPAVLLFKLFHLLFALVILGLPHEHGKFILKLD